MSAITSNDVRTKHPDEAIEVLFDLQDVLTEDVSISETVSSVVVAVSPSGPTLANAGPTTEIRKSDTHQGPGRNVPIGKGATVDVSGGTDGTTYTLTATITTSESATRVRKATLIVATS